MSTSLHFNCLLKVAWYEAGSEGSKQETGFFFLSICVHKATVNYINDQEDSSVFFLIILFILTINGL